MTQPYSIPWDRMGRWLWRNPGTIAADCIEVLLVCTAKRMVAVLAGFQEYRFAYRLALHDSDLERKDYSVTQIERAVARLDLQHARQELLKGTGCQ